LENQNVNAEELKTKNKDDGLIENRFAGVENTLKKSKKIKTTDTKYTKQQLSSPNIDGLNKKTKAKQIETSNFNLEKGKYVPVRCKWIDEVYQSYHQRENYKQFEDLSNIFKEKANQVEWISKIYRSLLAFVLHFSVLQKVNRNNLIKLCNAFTVLIKTSSFQQLPSNYPYAKDIVWLRDKLKEVCIETSEEKFLQLDLKIDTKKKLLLHQLELTAVFDKMSFYELLSELKNENNEGTNQNKEEQYIKGTFRRKLWRRKFKKRKQNNQTT